MGGTRGRSDMGRDRKRKREGGVCPNGLPFLVSSGVYSSEMRGVTGRWGEPERESKREGWEQN